MEQTLTIEFVGPPGVGKTTLSRELATRLADEDVVVREPTRSVADQDRLRRIATKFRFATGWIGRHPKLAVGDARRIYGTKQTTARDFIRVLFNWWYVCGLASRTDGDVRLLDQGCLQACWSIGYRSAREWSDVYERLGIPAACFPDVVVFVVASSASLDARLGGREANPSRVGADREEIERSRAGIATLRERLEAIAGPGQSLDSSSLTPDTRRIVSIRTDGDRSVDESVEQLYEEITPILVSHRSQ